MYVSCRGTPFKQDLPHLSTMCPREDICRLAVAGDGGGKINIEGLRMAG